ncbi:hypothetical protein [Polyangium jinanense]|uniref:Uncharacterized protein n=1 Tax=Polyangium jinanense TaxID=2829994 RepID=A0A9X4ATY3_9BACT|nr:hypothetical protein [Polyangium jinanense]MDC3957298.1 hypothetical protein [Polyangium jinanense]MDC3982700.1 hypothetical protein [Polyangium jinanense]
MEPEKTKRKKRSEPKIQIPLRKPYRQLVPGLILFGACAAFFFHRSSVNDRGLILNGLFHFDPDGADVFYAVLGVLSVGMSVMALLGILRFAKLDPFELVLGAKSLSFPVGRPMSMQVISVPIREIVSVGLQPPESPKSIIVQVRDGNVYWIPSNWLPKEWTVQDLNAALVERLRQQEDESAPPASNARSC